MALLAYLVLARTRGAHERGRLVEIFWPDADESRARRALNQSLYVLRRGLGHGVIVASGAKDESVGVDPDRIRCDARTFEELLEAERVEEALELYDGELLPGLSVSGCPGFERWLDGERQRLGNRALEAAVGLAREREEADPVAALGWQHQAALLGPYDEEVHRGLLRLLARSGDRGRALQEHEEFAARLLEDLERRPSPETAELVEAICSGEPGTDREAAETPAETDPGPVETEREAAPEADAAVQAGEEAGSRRPDSPTEAGAPAAEVGSKPPEEAGRRRPSGSRARPLEWVGAAILLVGVLALVGILNRPAGSAESSGPPTHAPGSRDEGADRVTILPFAVHGGSELRYLSEGMVELLGTALDGAGRLRTVDSRAVLSFAGRDGAFRRGEPVSPRDARAVAERFGADLFVLGSVVEASGRLRIQAGLYAPDGSLLAEAASEPGDEAEIFDLVEGVARDLIATRFGGAGGRLTRLAAATTSSVPALKAYLEGEGTLRAGRFDRALVRFRRAVGHDSTFALAWYRLAVAAEWTLQADLAGVAAERAERYAARLPPHDRLVIRAWRAYATGAAADAERLYRRALETHPDDLEAWLQLGEVRFHYGPVHGRPLSASAEAFRTVLALEPGHESALLHLARIAAREGEDASLLRHTDRLLRANPESELAVEVRALRAFAGVPGAAGSEAARRAVLDELRELDDAAVLTALWTVSYLRDPEAVSRVAGLLTHPRRTADVRALGHLMIATAEAARGRWSRARAELEAASRWNAAWALELGAFLATTPFFATDRETRDGVRSSLRALNPAATPPSLGASSFLNAHDGVHGILKTYLTGLFDVRDGHLDAARRGAFRLEQPQVPQRPEEPERAGPGGDSASEPRADAALARQLGRTLRTEILQATGLREAALASLEEERRLSPYELSVASPFHAGVRRRWLQAELLAGSGRTPEALAFLASLGDASVYGLAWVAPAHLRMAELSERQGERARAAEHYRRFLALWRDADPELRPAVTAARRSLALLEHPGR